MPEAWPARTWWEWLTATDYPRDFILVEYRSNPGVVLEDAARDGSIPNFVPKKFYDCGKIYLQLTPDGSLP